MATIEFVPLKDFENDYEILSQYPFTIRKKSNHYIISEWHDYKGYLKIKLNQKAYFKHVIIAKQFIQNDDPENKSQVDHRDKNKQNYHLENLRWATPSQNQKNKSSCKGVVYEYLDDIPDEAIKLTDYSTKKGKHEIENYYFHNDIFYFYNGIQYRKLHVIESKNGLKYVHMTDNNGQNISVYYANFKKQYDLQS